MREDALQSGAPADLNAKAHGVDITGETCPHHLILSTDDYAHCGGIIRVNPPVREASNQGPLWDALADGTIDMIATDHAPHLPEEKTREDIWTANCGFPGVETQMPLMLSALAEHEATILECVEPGPALGLGAAHGHGAGGGGCGSGADLGRTMRIDGHALHSRSKISPWNGRRVTGLPLHTLVRGRFVMRDRTLVTAPPAGIVRCTASKPCHRHGRGTWMRR